MNADILGIVGLLALLAMSAFFAMSEAALFSLQRIDREALREDPTVGETVRHLLAVPRRVLAAILMGNEVANIGLSAVSAEVLGERWHLPPWVTIAVVAPTLILFGDIVPKTLGIRFSRPISRAIARPMSFWNELVSPIRYTLTTVADAILKLMGFEALPPSEALEEQQLRALIDQGLATGVIQPMEQEMIHRVFEFGDLPVARLMTPRPDIFSLAISTPWAELVGQIRDARYSRVPIWQGSPENIIGILLVKDLLKLRGQSPPPNARQLQKLLNVATFVPPSKRAQDLLADFRKTKNHMALVVDEHGSCAGLITLDDLLTELVGEVFDETDAEEREANEIRAGVWTVKGGMDVDDFKTRVGHELPEGEYTTVGGLVFHLLGRAPASGDEVEADGLHFRIAGVDGRRITELTVTLPAAPDTGTEA